MSSYKKKIMIRPLQAQIFSPKFFIVQDLSLHFCRKFKTEELIFHAIFSKQSKNIPRKNEKKTPILRIHHVVETNYCHFFIVHLCSVVILNMIQVFEVWATAALFSIDNGSCKMGVFCSIFIYIKGKEDEKQKFSKITQN